MQKLFGRIPAIVTLLLAPLPFSLLQTVDPESIDGGTRDQWCEAQITQCPLLCLQYPDGTETESNTCDSDTLDFSCICSNGQSPNASEFSQTIPYFLCTETNNQCVKNCEIGDNECASDCRNDNPCGAQEPTRLNTSTIDSMSPTATGDDLEGASTDAEGNILYTGMAGEENSGSSRSKDAFLTVIKQYRGYGIIVTWGSIFAAFAFLL